LFSSVLGEIIDFLCGYVRSLLYVLWTDETEHKDPEQVGLQTHPRMHSKSRCITVFLSCKHTMATTCNSCTNSLNQFC